MPGTLELATEVESAVREADLAVDFVPDELESKLEIISMVDRMAPPKTIICMPTRVLEVNDLAACTYRADRFLGAHDAGDSITLHVGAQTSAEAAELAESFWRSLGRDVRVAQPSVSSMPTQ